jgi:hypothetical protein
MPAYIIVEIEITDPVGYEEYKEQAAATVEQYGGKYIVRGARAKRWKAIGNRIALLFCNLITWNGLRSGLIHPNMLSRESSVISLRRRE